MNEMIFEEVEKFKKRIRKNIAEPMSLNLIFNLSVVNALWRIITGCSNDLEDPKIKEDDIEDEEEMLAKAMALSLQEPSRINHEEEMGEEEMLAMALALSMVEK